MKKSLVSSDLVLLLLFFSLTAAMGASLLFSPPKSFSELENRRLQSFPKISATGLISGEFSRQLKSFSSDQLPLRYELSHVHALSELLLGKQEVNGVFPLKNGTLVQLPEKSSGEHDTLKNNLSSISKLQDRNANAVFLLAPRTSEVFADQLPSLLYELSTDSTASDNSPLGKELLKGFRASGLAASEYYYRTDHHWTSRGAYEAYRLLADELGYVAHDESFFTKEAASTDFYGTSFSKSALPKALIPPDTILLYRYQGDSSAVLTIDGYRSLGQGFYDLSALHKKDKYLVFLGGNYSHLSIELPLETDVKREKLLIIKDSFANSLIPFLALHFDIEAIDPRYTTVSHAKEICEKKEYARILVLCSADTLSSTETVGRILDVID